MKYLKLYENFDEIESICKSYGITGYFRDNPVNEIIELVNSEHIPRFIKYLNEFNVIVEGNKIFELGLEEAYYLVTKRVLLMSKRNFEHYQLI